MVCLIRKTAIFSSESFLVRSLVKKASKKIINFILFVIDFSVIHFSWFISTQSGLYCNECFLLPSSIIGATGGEIDCPEHMLLIITQDRHGEKLISPVPILKSKNVFGKFRTKPRAILICFDSPSSFSVG